ncbi:MAG: TolC family protein [Bacteroidetes bacterium]|nr:TolC family protein [Bacteroidota bacterium]
MKLKLIIPFFIVPLLSLAQKQLTEDEALSLALKNSAWINASSLAVTQSKQMQKTAYNISNPEIMMESPSGEFQTVGVLQSFNFPTVYAKQHQLLKQQTVLSQVGKTITENDIKYQIKSLYLSSQYFELIYSYYKIQDSIYNQIQKSAQRQYDAGQIDYLEKTFTDAQYGEIHNQFIQAQTDLQVSQSQLQTYTKLKEPISTTSLQKTQSTTNVLLIQNDTSVIQNNPSLLYAKQQQIISKKSLSLERNKFLPGFTLGYLNQGAKNTPRDLRIRAGINIPLWFWQYTGSINAAKTGFKVAEQKAIAQQQAISIEMQKAQGDYLKYYQSLTYYETIGLKQTDDIITTSKRFFEGGHTVDYISFLRTINDAYSIKLKYAESLKNYNQSVININYLTGSL